jgi:excisionase family DNA binding protein
MENDRYLTSSEAARALHVSPKTVSRWAKEGRIACIVTLGGHRRFHHDDVAAAAAAMAGKRQGGDDDGG